MLKLKRISMKNFFSFGNAPQVWELESPDMTLVLGQNNDALSDDESGERRNGVGKSSLIQGLVFGLYGKSIANDIKIPNLINKTNSKNLEIEIDFEKDGIDYRVERGRNPTYFNFYAISSIGSKLDVSRGEKKDTQEDLEEILGISQLLFEYIVVMNANVEPFLGLSQAKQREIIEELLGITQLSEKADRLKEECKENIKKHQQEKFKIDTITESNASILKSIDALEEQAYNFEKNKQDNIDRITQELKQYENLDIEELLQAAKIMEDAIQHNKERLVIENRFKNLVNQYEEYDLLLKNNKQSIIDEIERLSIINIDEEIKNHKKCEEINEVSKNYMMIANSKSQLRSKIEHCNQNMQRNIALLESEMQKLETIKNNTCPLCQNQLKCEDTDLIQKCNSTISTLEETIVSIANEIDRYTEQNNQLILPKQEMKPNTVYSSLSEALLHEHKLKELKDKLLVEEINIYENELINVGIHLDNTPIKLYENTLSTLEINTLRIEIQTLNMRLESEKKSVNPYWEQINTLKANSLKPIDYTEYNELVKLAEHQDFLVKLLTNKDSFVRKRIIDQNIQYLNSRLKYYIEKVDSEQDVEFMNDLSVDITLKGLSYDFKQLSRGERTRVVSALNLAFRDVHETTKCPINILVNDEIFEDGLDPHGVNTMWNLFKDYGDRHDKSIYIVSHREEVRQRAKRFIMIVKEDGFSSLEVMDSIDF